jgi:hypothetical protein
MAFTGDMVFIETPLVGIVCVILPQKIPPPQAPPGVRNKGFPKNNIPPPGLCSMGGGTIIGIKLPRLAATKPGRANPNRSIKAGTAMIAQPAGKRKR